MICNPLVATFIVDTLFLPSFVLLPGNASVTSNAKLGNNTEASIVILPSDDPNGVLEFAANSLQISVAEDYQPGYINTTYANLTVERKKGAFGSIQVGL